MNRPLTLIVAAALAILSCSREKERLQGQLGVLEQERAALIQRIDQRKSAVQESSRRIEALKSELTAYADGLESFMAGHRIAIECIRASRSTWGDSNPAFSHAVAPTTRMGAALCSVALLNQRFAAEVAEVTDRIAEGEKRKRELKEQIAAAERALDADRAEVQKSENAVDAIALEIADVQQQMQR